MAKTFKLKIVTPERQALAEDVEQVILPGVAGSFGVLAGHAPTLAALKPGVLKVLRSGSSDVYMCAGGYAEVSGKDVTVLADAVEKANEIDVERAKQALTRAQERIDQKPEKLDLERAKEALDRAKVRIAVAEAALKAAKN